MPGVRVHEQVTNHVFHEAHDWTTILVHHGGGDLRPRTRYTGWGLEDLTGVTQLSFLGVNSQGTVEAVPGLHPVFDEVLVGSYVQLPIRKHHQTGGRLQHFDDQRLTDVVRGRWVVLHVGQVALLVRVSAYRPIY
ncbi:hypothetical protein D3C84_827670 [compost metagenome]